MDDGLKQRLVGAIVLLAIAVLFLPGLLNRDTRRSVDLTSQLPKEPPVAVQLLDLPDPTPPEDIPPAKPLEDNYSHPAVKEGAAEPAAPAQVSQARPQAPALNAQGVPDAWSLQVASFQSSERAEAMLQELQKAGYKAYARQASAGQGTVHRVFVGPKIDKSAAEAEKRSIDEKFRVNALIVEFKP